MATAFASLSVARPSTGHLSMRTTRVRAPVRASRLAVQSKIDYIEASEVDSLVKEGYKIVDLRDEGQFNRARFVGVKHIPLYVEDTGKDVGSLVNQLAHASSAGTQFGTKHTIKNELFEEQMGKAFSKEDKLILACQSGLRSNGAALDLVKVGYKDLVCIEGGLNKLEPELLGDLKVEGKELINVAGKGGTIKYVKEISFAVGGVLFCVYCFLEFFPDQGQEFLKMMA